MGRVKGCASRDLLDGLMVLSSRGSSLVPVLARHTKGGWADAEFSL